MEHYLQPTVPQSSADLQQELQRAQQKLMTAEAELAAEQAAINAFRMHCRLQLDRLVDELLALQMEKQACLTRLELWRQADDLGVPLDDNFWETVETAAADSDQNLVLPTDTPRDKAAEKRLYRELARKFHPDLAQTAVEQAYRTSVMAAVNTAYAAGDVQALYDLAGELDPHEIAELTGIEDVVMRKLRQQILNIRRRCRRAQQRLQALRIENTARLYYKAQALDEGSADWWTLVRWELEEAITHRSRDIAVLRAQLALMEKEEYP